MRAKEFISEGPLGAIAGGIAKGVGAVGGVGAQLAKNFGKAALKGATQGRVDLDAGDSLGAALASALGLNTTAQGIQQRADAANAAKQGDIGAAPVDKQAAARSVQGKNINLPPLGQVKVNRVTPTDIELDTSKTGLGVPKIKLNPKDLAR